MKALKWIGIGVLGLGALFGAAFALIISMTSGAVTGSHEFLALVGEGKYEEAYNATAPGFRSETNLADFRASLKHYKIDEYVSASWHSRQITNGSFTRLEGTITTKNGHIGAVITLVKVGETWKVHGISLRPGGVS